MATYTPNLNLGKPEDTDPFENFRQLFNDNMDILDNGGGGGSGGSFLLMITADTGLTVTATKGGTTLTATETSTGVYEVEVTSAGTWTISDGTNTATVDIGIYTATLSSVPEGSTVLPTDDISIWLACGERNEGYTTLSQVLGDSVCLSALLNNNNANDYLVRSTTWASTITADSSAMSYIGLNNYCANILLADSTWCDAICNSEYFESVLNVKVPTMTSNTTPSGECFASSIFSSSYDAWKAFNESTSLDTDRWSSAMNVLAYIGYKFTESYKIKAVKYLVRVSSSDIYKSYTAVIEGSNDNAIWETIKTLNNDAQSVPITMVDTISSETSWQYVRFRFTSFPYTNPNNDGYSGMFALQFYGRKDI